MSTQSDSGSFDEKMRIFAISDIHIDFDENRRWLYNLSQSDYKEDILILAGDVTDMTSLLAKAFQELAIRFSKVLYVVGNHDLWVMRDNNAKDSLGKFLMIKTIARDCGICMEPSHFGPLSVVPLFGWYDYSYGQPSDEILRQWSDYFLCKWPDDFDEARITSYFVSMNEAFLTVRNQTVISFSHFLPRTDLMPNYIPPDKRRLYPVLGTSLLEGQIRRLASNIHIYGHSHVNTRVFKDNILYINNAFGYPHETRITAKQLHCVLTIHNS